MDSDSPLSNIDPYEAIGNNEDQGKATSWATSGDDHNLSRSSGRELATTSHDVPVGQIDYFAGFQEPVLPIPSIADRAKTRKRKSRTQRPADILELTDEDELNLKPLESKRKKKTKPSEKSKESPAPVPTKRSQGVDEGAGTASPTAPHIELRMINSKPKVAPRPIKKRPVQPPPSIPQPSIPIRTSPFPQHYYPPDTFHDHDLPPSDPPPTSSVRLDEHPQLPPIEFLPTEPIDSDAPLPSSQPGENIDELQEFNTFKTVNRITGLTGLTGTGQQPPPPPTFFAGSSSPVRAEVQPPAVPSPQRSSALPNVIDLTNIPSTFVEPAGPEVTGNVDDFTKVKKARRPRKPRKKADPTEDDTSPTEKPQPAKKKGKGKALQVIVEIPLPPPALDKDYASSSRQKRKRGNVLPPDELHLHADEDSAVAATADPVAGPSLPLIDDDKEDDIRKTTDVGTPEIESASHKGKRSKRKELPEPDGLSHAVPSTNKKSKAVGNLDDSEGVGMSPSVTRTPSKKRKKDDGDKTSKDNASKSSHIVRVTKGKRKMVITSDDEDAQLNQEDPLLPLEEREGKEAEPEAIGGNTSHSKLASPKFDRDALKNVDSRADEPDCKKATTPILVPSVNKYPSLSSRYSIAPQSQTSGMSELLKRVNSHPSSPFAAGKGSPIPGSAYSPYLKSSRRTLSRIAPLHPNRKPPPPPLPPPPPRKKSKKELDLEEKWEEEIIDDIGGITEWLALSESEKKDLKRMKRDREMGYCED